ncbi:MAG: TetR/AcrR family transcriptional regulator [Anaeromyxobacteraceae bacterium]
MAGTREEVLAAARDLLVEGGLRALTMRRVAERVGVSATAIYRHFDDKGALLGAAVALGSEHLVKAFAGALRARGAREQLRETGRAYLRFALRHPRDYQLLFMTWDDRPAPMVGTPRVRGAALEFLVDRVEACRAEGLLGPGDDTFEVVMLCWSVVHGLASLWLGGGARGQMTERQFEALADAVLDRALAGLFQTPSDGRGRRDGA